MPYKSDAQRRYFNANRAQLEAQGVDVDEWNDSSRGMKLPERAKKKKAEKSAKEAVVIKGNPKFVEGNRAADKFYEVLRRYLEQKGYGVSYDAGEPHTVPKPADLWLGHSRGVDRLRFAPEHTKTLALGAPNGINHPKDKAMKPGDVPGSFHYRLTKAMQKQLDAELESAEKSAVAMLAKQAAEASPEYKPPSALSSFLAGLGIAGAHTGQSAATRLYADKMIGKANPFFSRVPGTRMDQTWEEFKESLKGHYRKYSPLYKKIPKSRIALYDRIFKQYGKDAPFFTERTGPIPAAYSAKPNTVLLNFGIKDPHGGVLAHELGHAQQRKFLNSPLGTASRILPALGQLLGLGSAAMASDEDTGRNLALTSSASTLPMLGYEFDASRRGSKLLRDTLKRSGEWAKLGLGEKTIKRLAPFVGFPTYMSLASTPLLLHGVKKYLGGYGSYAKDPTFSEKIKALVSKLK